MSENTKESPTPEEEGLSRATAVLQAILALSKASSFAPTKSASGLKSSGNGTPSS